VLDADDEDCVLRLVDRVDDAVGAAASRTVALELAAKGPADAVGLGHERSHEKRGGSGSRVGVVSCERQIRTVARPGTTS
jgi:hypothetical protein